MPLDPQARAFLETIPTLGQLEVAQLDPAALRSAMDAAALLQAPTEEVARVEERLVPGPAGEIRVRLYAPDTRPAPAVVFFHGGGFVMGSLESHDSTCRTLVNAAGCAAVSVDYRLAPEHPFPAAPEDCYAATCWVAENAASLGLDPERLGVAGDSAGGNLAAAVALMARDRGGPCLRHQLLIYPVIDHAFDTGSYREHAEGYLLSRDMMIWFWGHYLAREDDGLHPYASPIRAESLADVAPAHVVTAECDPLRDEGDAYAERLRAAGVATTHASYAGLFHGFFSMSQFVESAKPAVAEIARTLRAALAESG